MSEIRVTQQVVKSEDVGSYLKKLDHVIEKLSQLEIEVKPNQLLIRNVDEYLVIQEYRNRVASEKQRSARNIFAMEKKE